MEYISHTIIRASKGRVVYIIACNSSHHPNGEWFAVVDVLGKGVTPDLDIMMRRGSKLLEDEARGFFPSVKGKYYK